MPEPEGRGAFHGDSRFQLREVVGDGKRTIEVEDDKNPGEMKKIQVPVLIKVDALIWSWDSTQRRWLDRLEWEATYGPADAPVWVPDTNPKHPGRWFLQAPAAPSTGVPVTGVGVAPKGPVSRRTTNVFRPVASKRDISMDDPHWLARAVQKQRGEAQRDETLRVREVRQLQRAGRVHGPISEHDLEAFRAARHGPGVTHALTLKAHWAHATIWLGKDAEFRDWAPEPSFVGTRIAIHAGSQLPEGWEDELRNAASRSASGALRIGYRPGGKDRPLAPFASLASDRVDHVVRTGSIVGTVLLAGVSAAGDGYVWHLREPQRALGVKIKGDRGLWPLPLSIGAELKASSLRGT